MSIKGTEINETADNIRAGNAGRLRLGAQLYQWSNRSVDLKEVEERLRNVGVEMPNASSRTRYRKAYEAWCVQAGLEVGKDYKHESYQATDGSGPVPMRLEGAAIDKLYLLKDEVTAENAVEVLAWSFQHTDQDHRSRKAGEAPEEAEEPTHKTITLEVSVYERFVGFQQRLASLAGNPSLSKTVALEFMLGQFARDDMPDETLDYMWRAAHGELTEEEQEALQVEEFDIA